MTSLFRVALIIPAYNEAERIGKVLEAALQVDSLSEIWVVADGCQDHTAEVARGYRGVQVISLFPNQGKGAALAAGVRATNAEVLLFLDADLVGLTPRHIQDLLRPVLNRQAMMSVGIFRQGRRATDWSQRWVPYISGQRALRRRVFTSLPNPERSRFGIETALTLHARRNRISICWVPLLGMTHVMKEEKVGWWQGLQGRVEMYSQILRVLMGECWRNEVVRPVVRRWTRWKMAWLQG